MDKIKTENTETEILIKHYYIIIIEANNYYLKLFSKVLFRF